MERKRAGAGGADRATVHNKGWWFIRRARQTAIVEHTGPPKRPEALQEFEWIVSGPFPTEVDANAHRNSVTSPTFDASDEGKVWE